MDPPELESAPKKSEKPRNPCIEFLGSDDWEDIRRVILEQKVPPGTPFLEYKNRIVPLGWDPIPVYTTFGTVGEAMAYFGKAPGGTRSDAGATAQSNVSTSNEECFSLEDTPANAEEDRSPSGEGALSNLRADCAEKSAGVEALSDAESSAESNVSTDSEEYYLAEDTPADAEEDGSPSGGSALSNLRDLGTALNHSTAHTCSRVASDDNHADPMMSEQLTRCDEVLVNLPASAERENIPEDDGGHQDITGESPTQEPVRDASEDEAEAIRKELSSKAKELEVAVEDKKFQKTRNTPKKFQKTRNTPISISTKCGTAGRGSGEEITEDPSARQLVGPGTSMKTVPPKIPTKKQKNPMLKQQNKMDRMQENRVNRMPQHDDLSLPWTKPFPLNPFDELDWDKILRAMAKEEVPRLADSFFFKGRDVPLGWKPITLEQFKEDRYRRLLHASRKVDAVMEEKLGTSAGASTSKLDAGEEQSQEEDNCTSGQPASNQKKSKKNKKKERSKRNKR